LRTRPATPVQPEIEWVERKFAHSDRLALPTITAPASVSRRTMGASRPVMLSLSAKDPAVVAVPSADSMLSFSSTGMPCRGPRTWPALRSASSLRASASAWGLSAITALSFGPVRSSAAIRARSSFTSCSEVSVPAVMAACWAEPEAKGA
jgi:hypothetical protein